MRGDRQYDRFASYSLAIAATVWLFGRLPISREYFEVLVYLPATWRFQQVTLLSGTILAITLGVIGLLRPGPRTFILSVAGIGLGCSALRYFIPSDWIIDLELAAMEPKWWLWDVPCSLAYDVSGGRTEYGLLFWLGYSLASYALLRFCAVRLWRKYRPSILLVWAHIRGASTAG